MAKGSGSGDGSARSSYPIAYSFAGLVLFALIALALLRHVFGSVRVEIGTH